MSKLLVFTLIVSFATAAFAADAPEPTKEKLVGTWNVKIGDVDQDLKLKEDGQFEQESKTGGMSGKWSLEKQVLILATEAGLKIRCTIVKLTDTELTVKMLGETIKYNKVKAK